MSPIRQNAASDSFNEIATVRITLRHPDPLIWRQVEVADHDHAHDIIQAVMGWFDYHLSGQTKVRSIDDRSRLRRSHFPSF